MLLRPRELVIRRLATHEDFTLVVEKLTSVRTELPLKLLESCTILGLEDELRIKAASLTEASEPLKVIRVVATKTTDRLLNLAAIAKTVALAVTEDNPLPLNPTSCTLRANKGSRIRAK